MAVVTDAQGATRATGRRKQAIVRVRIRPGSGQWTLNGKTLEAYFPNKVHQQIVSEPLKTLERDEAYDVIATLRGGGVSGQAGALRLGIARALRSGESLPPVTLYRVGGRHFVQDGHHRVSASRAVGRQSVDAYVTEVLVARGGS